MATQLALTANGVLNELKACGVTHIVWLPDTEANFIYEAIQSSGDFRLVNVCREGETFAIAAGLTVGGKEPVVLIQNTGFFESGDSVRGLTLALGLPLLVMIGYRGWRGGQPMSDTAGVFTEPMLKAWGIPYYLLESDADLPRIRQAHREAHERSGPVAVLIGREYE